MWSDVEGCRRWVARRNSKVGYRARLRVCTPKVWLSVLCHLGCGGEEAVGRIMQKGSSPSGKAERRAMCQIKPGLNFVGGPHSGWQRLEKEDKMLGRLVLLLFCIRNIPSLKVQRTLSSFFNYRPLARTPRQLPEFLASLKLGPPQSNTFSLEETRNGYAGYIHVCIHLNYPITVYEYVHLLRTQRLLLLILALFSIYFLLTGRA